MKKLIYLVFSLLVLSFSSKNEIPKQKAEIEPIQLVKKIKSPEKNKTKKKVLTYGTFDLFHYGHQNLFDNIASLFGKNTEIYVGVSSDEFNAIKGKEAMDSFEVRSENVKKQPNVVKTFTANNWKEKVGDIKRIKPDILVRGPDWAKKYVGLNKFCKVICLPRTPGISSTMLREKILREKNRLRDKINALYTTVTFIRRLWYPSRCSRRTSAEPTSP